ncbi:MAG: hypothetical protein D6675_16455 [Gemmatimonadetes bacterium]|nr:MAG: hypothetical protein D6675_16455 [Gemmatimonadota bacterium]
MAYRCPSCGERAPALYVREYKAFPPVVLNAVGFRQHGKTVYFAALFYALKKLRLASHWDDFFTMSLDEDSLNTVYENMRLLEAGRLPNATPRNFPRPTMLRVYGVPFQPSYTLLCYDTGGECFEKPNQLVQFAGFVRRAKAVLFLMSLGDMKDANAEAYRLLNTYLIGMGELGGNTHNQHLIVVCTKADQLVDKLPEDVVDYLIHGTVKGLIQHDNYMTTLYQMSTRLRTYIQNTVGAYEFLNAADAHFKSVNFSVISALGAAPEGSRLPVEIVPRRVFDPLFWAMEKSRMTWKDRLYGLFRGRKT